MTGEIEDLISEVRKKLEQKEERSLAGILRETGISPENPDRIKSLLGGLGHNDSQLFDPVELARIAGSFLASMPEETRRQLLGVVFKVAADMNSGNVPREISETLSSHVGEKGAGIPPGES